MKTLAALASVAFVTLFVVLGALAACNKADLTDAPDADMPCNAGAHAFCNADAAAGCTIGPGEPNPYLKQLAPGTYAPSCVANFVEQSRDPGGDCVYNTCLCVANPDGGAGATWNCH